MNNNEYQKKWRNEWKKNGYCVGCGEKLDREGSYCKKCREKINKNVREQRHWYQDNGICPRCGKNSLFGDEKVFIKKFMLIGKNVAFVQGVERESRTTDILRVEYVEKKIGWENG